MTLWERGGRKESIEGRIYGEKIDWRMRREGLFKTKAVDSTPLSSEETFHQDVEAEAVLNFFLIIYPYKSTQNVQEPTKATSLVVFFASAVVNSF